MRHRSTRPEAEVDHGGRAATGGRRRLRAIAARIAIWAVVVGVFIGAVLVFILLAGLLSPLSLWIGLPILFVVSVLLASGIGSLVYYMEPPQRWLVLAACGLMLALGPLLLYWMLGSWEAEFAVPRRRGGVDLIGVAVFGRWCAITGGALALAGGVGYALGKRREARV